MYTMKLSRKNHRINIKKTSPRIVLKQTGKRGVQGIQGIQGPTGEGMPTGGLTGELVRKASDADFDFEYVAQNEVADKNYVQNFIASSFVTVNHNLNKIPSINVIDSAGDEVVGQVQHLNTNAATLTFNAPFSGQVTCN